MLTHQRPGTRHFPYKPQGKQEYLGLKREHQGLMTDKSCPHLCANSTATQTNIHLFVKLTRSSLGYSL